MTLRGRHPEGVRGFLFVLVLLAGGAMGCSWLVGVSEDPIITDGTDGVGGDAGDEDAAADSGAE